MKTHTIRLTEHEYEIARKQAQLNSLNVSDIARLVIAKTVRVKRIPDHIQKVSRKERSANRSKRLNFKLDPDLSTQFKVIIVQHKGNVNMSDVFRFYMNSPEQLFEKTGKRARARVEVSATAKARDFYQTPHRVTERFIDAHFGATDVSELTVLEPCAGHGAISSVLRDRGVKRITEIDKYFIEPFTDFLETDSIQKHDWVITNPPYSSAVQFIQRSLKFADNAAFLLPLDYLHGGERFEALFSNDEFYCSDVYVLVKRPTMTQEQQPQQYANGQITFAWFVFKAGQTNGHIRTHHIDNDADIARLK